MTFNHQVKRKLASKPENLVLSFNLTKELPVASPVKAAAPVQEIKKVPVPKVKAKEVIKPIEKPVIKAKPQNLPVTTTEITQSASETTPVNISQTTRSNYENLLASWLSKYKTYPTRAKRRHLTGEATIFVKIGLNGQLLDYKIKNSTGHQILDEAIVTMIERANPMPRIPDEFQRDTYEFIAPVAFELN